MATQGQDPPMARADGDEVPDTSRDTEATRVNGTEDAPQLPQRPVSTHPQALPQTQPAHVPYTGQPNEQFAYATPVRPLPKQSSAYIATRLGLTVLSSVWGIIIVALTSILLSTGGTAAAVSFYAYIIVVVSILWNTAELITYCVRLRKQVQRGIHPGAHVGLHLVFWLAGIFAILLSVSLYVSVEYSVRLCDGRNDDDDDSYYGYSYCDEYQPYDYYRWNVLSVFRALIAIFVLWAINHFVLFVLACIETHKRNTLKPTAFLVPAHNLSTVPAQGMYYPQQPGSQPMQPIQYYPYPIMMQPQPAHVPGAESRGPIPTEKQPAQTYQNLAGFYAPTSGPSVEAPSNNASAAPPARNAEQA
ncbi:hypothetical protein ANO14919_015420 [Xylariales sp. No.14919]|nr:hypothetical protein F5X98DRAFT_369173 [Xylaria grammica]GAW12181.1 hypothetical protein ANO14919_015420 [Xylariales sp. No.14919]